MEFNFDDELSEEWISQPRSSDVSDLQEDTSVLRRSTNGSRIPLPKSQSTSSLLRRTQGHVLSEKTASALNVEKSGALAKEHGKGYPQGTASASSAEELGSVLLGTVQLKGQEGAKQGTPEWKRRLLNSGGAARNQQGLFSPIGLENVFRPPTVRKEMSARFKRARTSAPTTSIPPSSPPVLPGRILPPMATQSPDESLQLPPLAPVLPSLQTSLRHSSGARSHALSGKSYLRHESFSPVQLDSDNRRTRRSHSGSLSICRDSSVHDISRPASSMSDGVLEIRGLGPSAEDSQVDPNRTSSSLPENLQPESEAYAFVTMRRGGYSSEGSFQQKPLSPSSFQPQSTPARPALDGRLPEVCSTPQTPRTKHKPQGDNDPLEQSPRLSRSPQKLSPLKLFDKYDTFTNDRLNRRISQFEIGGDRTENESDIFEDGMGSTPSPRREQQAQEQDSYPARKQNKRMSSFGDGMLDKFDFTHEQEAQRALQWPEEENRMQSASDPTSNKAKSPESSMVESQETHKQFNMVVKKQQTMGTSWEEEISEPLPEGKRQRSSPQKVPNAKRRRTIQQSPENGPGIEMQRQRPQLSQNNSIAGRKRKDALYNNSSPTADPEVIATRPMLRPKVRQQNSPGGSRQISVAKTADTDDSDETEKPVIDLETATGLLAGELANLALNVAEGITQGVRKKSVTTADFFREANLIMQNIRSNAIQRDGVRNVLGSDMGRLQGIEESGADVFSTDTFSRPPSREGSPPRRKVPGPKDFRVISRLRKFEDTDDLGLALNSSFKRLRRREHNDDDVVSETAQGELSNVRILEPIRNRQFGEAGGVGDSAGRDKDAIAETYPSSKSSTNRSIHTGSSGTRTKAIIAPEKVSHLIMDKMGRMTFDYEKRCWVKRKPSEDHSAAGEHLASEATEDDPFKEIPDLDIDESHELRNVRGTAISQPTSTRKLNKDQLPPMPNQPLKETPFCDPHPEDAQSSVVIGQSGSPPSVSAMDRHIASTRPLDGSNRAQEAAVEIALSKGQVAQILVQAGNKPTQARAVTVAFSSPLIQPHPVSPVNEWDDASRLDLDANSFLEGDAGRRQNVNEGEERSSRTPRSRLSSSIKRTQSAQILPKIDEGEKTPSPSSGGNRTDDLAIALATPQVVAKKAKGMLLAPSAAKSYVAMQLTPLSDFTIHHADESLNLDVQYLAKRRGLASIQEIEGKFSLSIKDLVEKIADVEPYEPYWEQLRSLSLPGRGLFTLHMLDDFCNSIEELDVSNNELGQLNGAPQSLRVLDARHNCLSSLTAWGHLYNLQYIDISNNEIDSLVGFRELLHIRELKAENNQIDSLDGVLHLNGLLKLQLGNNCIKALNLHDSDLRRLTDLDLHDNQIESVNGIEQLVALQRLQLRGNKLHQLNLESNEQYPCLSFLDVSNNQLTRLDVAQLGNLCDLLLDSNSVVDLNGLGGRPNIQRVSWRTQTLPSADENADASFLDYNCCSETRSLSLAGNRLLNFNPSHVFLSLERLDLASCGLDSLVKDFGTFIPNVRHLNLNYNALKDIRPLLGIRKLQELHIAGNRIIRFRRTMDVICKIGQHLRILDCRNNQFSSGFYLAPHLETVSQKLIFKPNERLPNGDGNREDCFNTTAYIVPDADGTADEPYLQQLDFGTRIRRRVYELMLLQGSRSITKLDGLPVDGQRVLAKDGVWEKLVELGVIQLGRAGSELRAS